MSPPPIEPMFPELTAEYLSHNSDRRLSRCSSLIDLLGSVIRFRMARRRRNHIVRGISRMLKGKRNGCPLRYSWDRGYYLGYSESDWFILLPVLWHKRFYCDHNLNGYKNWTVHILRHQNFSRSHIMISLLPSVQEGSIPGLTISATQLGAATVSKWISGVKLP